MANSTPALQRLSSGLLRAVVRRLPARAQRAASKHYFYRQIRQGAFRSAEVEWDRLGEWLRPGDWCIDVGANIGRYTLKMSNLVGPTGHVVAFEPLTRSFDLLTHFVEKGAYRNVTLLNAAATSQCDVITITPDFAPLNTAYIFDTNTRTQIATPVNARTTESKLGLTIDALNIPNPVRLIKIDVEGHELEVCRGMTALLERDHPMLIIEHHDDDRTLPDFLARFGYTAKRLYEGSRNCFFEYSSN